MGRNMLIGLVCPYCAQMCSDEVRLKQHFSRCHGGYAESDVLSAEKMGLPNNQRTLEALEDAMERVLVKLSWHLQRYPHGRDGCFPNGLPRAREVPGACVLCKELPKAYLLVRQAIEHVKNTWIVELEDLL